MRGGVQSGSPTSTLAKIIKSVGVGWGLQGGDDKDANGSLVAAVGKQMINQFQRIGGQLGSRKYCPGQR